MGRGPKWQWGRRQRKFSPFSLPIFSETLVMRPALLYSDTQSVVSFSVIPKCMISNNIECLFRVKLFPRRFGWLWQCTASTQPYQHPRPALLLCRRRLGLRRQLPCSPTSRKIFTWKLIKTDIRCQQRKCFGSDSSFSQYKVRSDPNAVATVM